MEQTDIKLLTLLQKEIPLISDPYAGIASMLDGSISRQEVLSRAAQWKESGMIRRISGFFDPGRLGYRSVLCAMTVAEEHLEEMADLLEGFPGITHNYLRDHMLNMWFTLCCRDGAEEDRIIGKIEASGRTGRVLRFRKTSLIKLSTMFVPGQAEAGTDSPDSGVPASGRPAAGTDSSGGAAPVPLTEEEISLVRVLQEDFPLCERPFARIGEALGCGEDRVLELVRGMKAAGTLRRISAALNHTGAGYTHNSMIVWNVPGERAGEAAESAARFRAISHCYLREPLPEFDYNLYTMVHAAGEDQLRILTEMLEKEIRPVSFCSLKTLRQFKKTGMKFFEERHEQ
ncbi:MAG: hypothetical protein IKE56_08955 [Lachnospiraceae bacterium]|nr:hypothetical protein [Clostridia bacterium]MBR2532766.1 hypothetical protein [Lachnospiraceae bacterium]